MGRLIDAAELNVALLIGELYGNETAIQVIDRAPTVEAIPKADYNARLKADMVAMLEELKEQLREMHEDYFERERFDEAYGVSDSMDIIQQKINSLKAESEEE